MQVSKWGNSLAVRIPADVAKTLGLKEGDQVDLVALGKDQLAVVTEQQRREAALARIRSLSRPLPENWKMSRDEMHDRTARPD